MVAIFCNRIIAGEPINVNAKRVTGDPGCIRDYVYIDDVAGANVAALEGKIPDSILNVGTGQETSTLQLTEILQKKLGNTVTVNSTEKRAGDIERSLLDADRLVELLGPVVSIDEGLAQTAKWFRERAESGTDAKNPS